MFLNRVQQTASGNTPSRFFLHAQYDWTTGVSDNGNDWRKFRVVPRSHPFRPLVLYFVNRGGNRRVFRLPGAGGGSCPLYGGTFARSYSVSIRNPGNTNFVPRMSWESCSYVPEPWECSKSLCKKKFVLMFRPYWQCEGRPLSLPRLFQSMHLFPLPFTCPPTAFPRPQSPRSFPQPFHPLIPILQLSAKLSSSEQVRLSRVKHEVGRRALFSLMHVSMGPNHITTSPPHRATPSNHEFPAHACANCTGLRCNVQPPDRCNLQHASYSRIQNISF